jgi:hypothetical protein
MFILPREKQRIEVIFIFVSNVYTASLYGQHKSSTIAFIMSKLILFGLIVFFTIYFTIAGKCYTHVEILRDGSKRVSTFCEDADKTASSSFVNTDDSYMKSRRASESASNFQSKLFCT